MSRVSFIGILSCLTCANGSRQHISSLTFHLNKMYDLALNTAVKVTETVAQLLTKRPEINLTVLVLGNYLKCSKFPRW